MNYQKQYNKIIQYRLNNIPQGYTEKHHIIPRSLGGTNDKNNLVRLTAREHFICHYLLTKIYKQGTKEWIKMVSAFSNMLFSKNDKQERYYNSRLYSYGREQLAVAMSLSQSGQGNSQYGKRWIINPKTGQAKSLRGKELQEHLDNGWIFGRSLRKKPIPCNKTIDKMPISEEEKRQRKKEAFEQRKMQRAKIKEKRGRCYLFINKQTGKHKLIALEDVDKLTEDWYSSFYVLDQNKQLIEDNIKNGITLTDIAKSYNIDYDNFYFWLRKHNKHLIQLYQKIHEKSFICQYCGKQFIRKDKRNYCSKECREKATSNRIWIKLGEEIKHIGNSKLQEYLKLGWKKIKPIPGKPSTQWPII